MNVLSLDLGTSTGYAFYSEGALLAGTANFKPNKFDGGGARLLKFKRWLDEIHAAAPVQSVVYEGVRNHKGVDAAHVYGGLMGTLMVWCEEQGVPYQGYGVGTIKAFVTGKGNASKGEVIKSVFQKFGYLAETSDEADALALLHLHLYDQGVFTDDGQRIAIKED